MGETEAAWAVMGPVTCGWCPHCKAETLAAGEVLILGQYGVTPAGQWAACEVCDWSPHGQAEAGRG